MPDLRSPDEPEKIADAASVFDTDEIRPFRAPAPAPSPPTPAPSSQSPTPAGSDGYELEANPFGGVENELEAPPRPVALPTPVERPKASAKSRPKAKVESPLGGTGDTSEFETEFSNVDPVWTRGAEWMPDLVRVGASGLATLVGIWFFWTWGWLPFLILVLGGLATVLLCYPMLITLERPVRITPEQAVKDFFAAASHHFPHYRRMWLLLSSAARDAGRFEDFDDFRSHWESQIKGWKAKARVGKFTPLKFDVEDFGADKSAGKSTSRAEYTVFVFVRDQEDASPLASFRMIHGLVKGPDRMWYLNRGVLESKSSA